MKKFFSLFAVILFAGSMMAAVGNVFYTFVPQKYSSGNVSDYTKSGDQEIDGLTWTVPGNWYASGALRIGGKSIENVDRVIAGKTAMGDAIAKIVIAHAGVTSDNLKLNSVKVTVASDADFTQDVTETVAVAETDFTVAKNTEGTIELTPKDADFWAKDAYYKFAFNVTNTNGSNYAFVLNKIEFYSYSDVEITYWTVAGSSATLFGTAWAPANKDNDMVKQEDGSYKWEKTDIELAAGKVEFKVVKNHSWDEAYPSENYELNIAEAGKYTITINFNPESKEVTANAEKTGEAEVDPTAAVRGSFNGWAGGDMTLAEDKKSASIVLALEEKDYEFKMVINDAWLGNGYTFHRDFTSVEGLDENTDNMKLQADVAGDYTITWTFESKKMEITFPKKPEVLPEGAFKLTFNGTGEAGKDASAAYGAEVEAIFDAASAPYVASVQEATKVYAGRPIDDDNSSLKFGTSSAAGSLAFTLATPVEVDSIIVNATQYGNDAAEVTVNGVKFDLTAGNKVPTDCKLVANGEISQITIAQTGSQRIYVRSVKVFPKAGEVPPVDEPKFYVTGGEDIVGEGKATWAKEGALVSYKDTLELDLAAGYHELKLITPDDQWLGYNELTGEIPAGITTNEWTNIIFTLDEAGIVKVIYIAGDPRVFTLEGNFSTDVPVVLPVVAIAGAMNEWSADANILGPEEGDEKASAKIALEAQDYNFKVVVDGQWRCYKGQVYDITRENATLPGINEEGGYDDNFNLKADVAGEYTFTWIYATNTLEITFPEDGPVPPVDEPKFYITGTANLVGEESAWQPNALPVKEESAVLSLEPGAYMMKITLKGNWTEGVLGFDELTGEIPEGVTRGKDGDDNNICFTLAEAGDVTVTYTGEVFTIAGNFYVEPAGDPTVAVIGDMTEWAAEIPFILSEDKKTATLYNDNIKAGTYEFKLKVNGEWRSNGYTFHRDFTSAEGITENLEANMVVIIDVEGEYTFTWTFETNKLEITFPEKGEGIEEILSEGKAVKVIREGNLIILKGDKAYNAMGQIVK